MRKFEKKYCFEDRCFEVDKNLKKSHLDALNKNKKIYLTSVSGGMESPAHIIFGVRSLNIDLNRAEEYLHNKIPTSKVKCFSVSKGGYVLDKQNKDAHGRKRRPSEKICDVTSKKQKSACFWRQASRVISNL